MLANIVRKEITEPLSIEMLQRLVPSWCRVSFYDKLAKYKSLKDALQGKKCMIVLYNVHKDSPKRTVENKAGHFILINTAQGTEYFSSSGWGVAAEIAATHSDPKIFQRLLGNKFIQNKARLEKNGNSNTCWRFCLARSILLNMPLNKFQKLFTHILHLSNPDAIVTALTLLQVEKQTGEILKRRRVIH
jgi:hypothetical protein